MFDYGCWITADGEYEDVSEMGHCHHYEYDFADDNGMIRIVCVMDSSSMVIDLNPDTVTKYAIQAALKLIRGVRERTIYFDTLHHNEASYLGVCTKGVSYDIASRYLRGLINPIEKEIA